MMFTLHQNMLSWLQNTWYFKVPPGSIDHTTVKGKKAIYSFQNI